MVLAGRRQRAEVRPRLMVSERSVAKRKRQLLYGHRPIHGAVALRISAQPCFRAKKLQPSFEKSGCSCKIKICDYQIFYKRIIQKIQMDIN